MMFRTALMRLAVALALAPFAPPLSAQDALPERPAIDRDVHMTEMLPGGERPSYTRPFIPPVQTTADGRIGVSNELIEGKVAFRLLVPEKLDVPFMLSAAGTGILAHPDSLVPEEARISGSEIAGGSGHLTLCDPSLAEDATFRNPFACGPDGGDDCYRVFILRTDHDELNPDDRILHGTMVELRVDQPKTTEAKIVEVRVGISESGPPLPFKEFFEPMTTADGKLLVVRNSGKRDFTWTNSLGEVVTSASDIVYLVHDDPDTQQPCDVAQWDKWYPLSHAPYDDTINRRYGFAMQLFRNTNNTVIAEGTPMSTYPWIDKDGDNVSFVLHTEDLYDPDTGESDFETRCVVPDEECVGDIEAQDTGRLEGRVIMGLWTRGKMVVLDDLTNNVDLSLQGDDGSQREVKFYEAIGGDDGYTRVGNGRDNRNGDLPFASSGNTTFFDTPEHRFNYLPNLFPITPRDVTWLASSGRGTDEIPFDDYVNPNMFINATMTTVVEFNSVGSRKTIDGQIQNAATGGRLLAPENAAFEEEEWAIPTHGEILGAGRLEWIAKGGVFGKGFWLDGLETGLRFTIPSQSRNIDEHDWYYGIFVDLRDDLAGDIALLSFPDGSRVRLRNGNQIVILDPQGEEAGSIATLLDLPAGAWAHLGLQLTEGNRRVSTYVNGFRTGTLLADEPVLRLVEGDLEIGTSDDDAVRPLRGWIDDFKATSEKVGFEVACNLAAGTLAGISGSPDAVWVDLANGYPQQSHDLISNLLAAGGEPTFGQYVCFHDYSDDLAAHLRNIPVGLASVRDGLNFPEGPIFQDRPRPDSSQNRFCLSCHTAGGMDGMGLDALAFDSSLTAPFDPRRQPTQPNALVYGNIPANWLGEGKPTEDRVADPVRGFRIDRLILPSSAQ